MKIIGFDTETVLRKNDKYRSYEFYSAQFFSSDLKLNRYITDPLEVANVFSNKTRGAILLASNAEYDFSVLAKILDRDYFQLRCLYNKSRFLYGKISRKDHVWSIYDLRNIFTNWSLAKMGKFLKLLKLDKPSYLGMREPQTAAEKFYFKLYAMRDAEIGYYAGKWLIQKFGKLSLSLPSMAFKYFNKEYKPKGLYLQVDSTVSQKLRMSYKGGRCESWVRGSPNKDEYCYDAVSLYPSVMFEKSYPMGIRGLKHRFSANLCKDGIALATVRQDCDIPFLCIKTMCADNNIKLVFPNGTFEGWFTYPELRYFQNKRLGKILKITEAYETNGCKKYFAEYVNDFFSLKKSDFDHADFWKLCMNSLYGKFAQDVFSPELQINADNTITQLPFAKKSKENFMTNILVSSYITAYSRIKMHHYYTQIGAANIAYTDTDSIHSFKEFVNSGNGLGELAFKVKGRGTYVRSKFYVFNDMVRCRGMERIFEAEHVRKLIEMNDVTIFSKVLLRLRSAFRQHKQFLTEKDGEKHFSLNSDCKRVYAKELIGKELLDSYTESSAVVLHGAS